MENCWPSERAAAVWGWQSVITNLEADSWQAGSIAEFVESHGDVNRFDLVGFRSC